MKNTTAFQYEKANRKLLEVLALQRRAWDSYTDECNPSRKMKKVADWGLINEAWMALDKALAENKAP